ncbi:MAG: nickel pincer cofactor biosynthesis protein LarB [Hyphomonadaceae bacterium]|nr:nickel pincer cofactor biosynthesis protein LarB [Clostridia bacterium]
MEVAAIREMLEALKAGKRSVDDVMGALKTLPFSDLGYAKLDHHRALRNGVGEVIYCEGKALPHIQGIVQALLAKGQKNILATRASRTVYETILSVTSDAIYHELARIVVIAPTAQAINPKKILVVTGGTADVPVAEEAAITAEVLGNHVERLYDVGVAGIHRLLSHMEVLQSANVLIAVAGMEGALASVVGGLVDKPVIAVPTSVGYGANFGGLSALLCMLNSCAAGIGVVNIDNGFGAGFLANSINRL